METKKDTSMNKSNESATQASDINALAEAAKQAADGALAWSNSTAARTSLNAAINALRDAALAALHQAGVEAANYIDHQQRRGAPLTFFAGEAAHIYAAAATRDDVSHLDAMRTALAHIDSLRASPPPAPAVQQPHGDLAVPPVEAPAGSVDSIREALAELVASRNAHRAVCKEWSRKNPPAPFGDPRISFTPDGLGLNVNAAPEIDAAVVRCRAAWEAAERALAQQEPVEPQQPVQGSHGDDLAGALQLPPDAASKSGSLPFDAVARLRNGGQPDLADEVEEWRSLLGEAYSRLQRYGYLSLDSAMLFDRIESVLQGVNK